MDTIMVPIEGKVKNQTVTIVIDPDGRGVTLRLQAVYHAKIDKWMMTVWNAASGECMVSNFPIVGSARDTGGGGMAEKQGGTPFLNDLMGQFGYMGIGSCACYCIAERPKTPDPAMDTLDEFELLWGDHLGK